MKRLIGLVQVLISKIPALPEGLAAGAAAVFSLIYTYILNGGKEHDTVEKIFPEIFQKFEINYC